MCGRMAVILGRFRYTLVLDAITGPLAGFYLLKVLKSYRSTYNALRKARIMVYFG